MINEVGIKENNIYVSIVIPTFNEENCIVKVIDDIHKAMKSTSYLYEIIVVDDCSTDSTLEKLKTRSTVRVIKHQSRRGSGAARRAGIKETKGEIVVMIDGDDTYPANEISKLLRYFPEYDQVNGARTSESGSHKQIRSFAKWIIRNLACLLTNQKIPDLNTGLKAFKRSIALKYLWALPDGFSCVSSITLSFLCNGHSVKYVPIEYFPRRKSESKFHPIKDTYMYLVTVIRMITYFQPMKVFLPPSILLFFLGIVKTLIDYRMIQRMQLSDVVIFMASFVIFCLGVLADLIVAQARQLGAVNEETLRELLHDLDSKPQEKPTKEKVYFE